MANTATIKVKVDDKELQNFNKELNKTAGEGFERLANKAANTAKVIRGGFDIAIGGAALFGQKSKESMEKLANGAIIVANTFNGIDDLLTVIGKNKWAQSLYEGFVKASTGAKILKAALAATGLVLLFTGIQMVIENWDLLMEKIGLGPNPFEKRVKTTYDELEKRQREFELEKARGNKTLEDEVAFLGEILAAQEAYYSIVADNEEEAQKVATEIFQTKLKRNTILKQLDDKALQDEKDRTDFRKKLGKDAEDENVKRVQKAYELAVRGLKDQFEIDKQVAFNKKFFAEEAATNAANARKEEIKNSKLSEKEKAAAIKDIDIQLKDELALINDEYLLDIRDAEEAEKQRRIDRAFEIADASIEAARQLQSVFNELADQRLARIEQEREARLESLEAQKDLELGIYAESEKDRAIIEEKFRAQRLAEEEKYAAQEKQIRKRQADIQLAITIAEIIANTGRAIMAAAPVIPLQILAGVTGAAQLAGAIAQRQAVNKLAQGGMLVGPSHANGGIYMGGGVEAEGGEAVINKRSSRMFGGLLSAVNQAGGGVPIMPGESIKGGINTTTTNIIDYDQLASAMARNPVKAFVVTQDITLAQNQQTAIQSKATIA